MVPLCYPPELWTVSCLAGRLLLIIADCWRAGRVIPDYVRNFLQPRSRLAPLSLNGEGAARWPGP